MTIQLREIKEKDLKSIFKWRNHPSVRKMMFDTSELVWEKHLSFWLKLLKDDLVIKYMIEKEEQSCGIIRLDLNKNKTVGKIDIFINPDFHGQGIGTSAIKELIKKQKNKNLKKIIAQVIPENIGSEKMFKKSGFTTRFIQLEYDIKKKTTHQEQ